MKNSTFYLLLLTSTSIFSQRINISGSIADGSSGEKMIGVSIGLTNSTLGTSTNKYGFFSLNVPSGKNELIISFIGYSTQKIQLDVSVDTTLQINLFQSSIDLGEVLLKNTIENTNQNAPSGRINIPISRLKAVPMIIGEPDIIKALAMTPGVNIGNEGTANILVRGGSSDQNMILLDDVPVYNVSHLFGIISIFNSDAIKNVDLFKAGFPARYGGRLSSVIDITMNEGNNQKKKSEVSIGLINSKYLIEGPTSAKQWGKSSYMISMRSSYLTPFLLPQIISFNSGKSEQAFNYWLYDINTKLNFELKNKGKLFFSMYRGNDYWNAKEGTADVRSNFNLNWGNQTYTLRYNKILNQKLFFKSVLAYSKFNYKVGHNSTENKKKTEEFELLSSLSDFSIKSDFEYFQSPTNDVRFGLQNTIRKSQPSFIQTIEKASIINRNHRILN